MKQHTYRITALAAGSIKIDGGRLFGTLPKQRWNKIVRADSENCVTLPGRVLLVETPSCTALFDTGPGLFCVEPTTNQSLTSETCNPLIKSLTARGIAPEQISHIFLSHLHFNTAGGLFTETSSNSAIPFKKAKIYVGKEAFRRSCSPHMIDQNLFIPGTGPLLKNSHSLKFISDGQRIELDEIVVSCTKTRGHSPGMAVFHINRGYRYIITGADLLPGMAWTDLCICSNLEYHPELLVEEKQNCLTRAADRNAWIFYPHDPNYGFSKIRWNKQICSYVPTDWGNGLTF